ncbi:MAG: FixH family protein [Parasphingorhabdus sp.]|uniref:FixH family protein n=1 Tax=Parasphingorhabdus sp. TaxID=2709688 RepID=UPI0030032A5F
MTSKPQPKKITGYHAAAMIIAFFAVVVCVNLVMARFAVSTFGGTVVDNSYVASQKYNKWLEQARSQASHGWSVSPIKRVEDKAVMTLAQADGTALRGADISAVAEHPVGRTDPISLRFQNIGDGIYASIGSLPAGRWKLKINISYEGKKMTLAQDIR